MIGVSAIRKILVIKFKHIGDVLLTTALFRNLRTHFPDAFIAAAVFDYTAPMLTDNPDIDKVFLYRQHSGFRERCRILGLLRRERFDLAIDLTDGDRGAIAAFASGSPVRLGFRSKRHKLIRRDLLFTHLMENRNTDQHTVRYNLEPLRALGLETRTEDLRLCWPREIEEGIAGKLETAGLSLGAPFAVIHPTSRWLFKCWTESGNATVIDSLWNEYHLPSVITSDRTKRELQFVEEILKRVRAPVIDWSGQLSLKELAALMKRARIVVSTDTAPMHIAAAVQTPVIALFGPSGDSVWGPWGEGHRVIKKGWPCQPCGQDGCDGSKISRCLTEIEPGEVMSAVRVKLRELTESVHAGQVS